MSKFIFHTLNFNSHTMMATRINIFPVPKPHPLKVPEKLLVVKPKIPLLEHHKKVYTMPLSHGSYDLLVVSHINHKTHAYDIVQHKIQVVWLRVLNGLCSWVVTQPDPKTIYSLVSSSKSPIGKTFCAPMFCPRRAATTILKIDYFTYVMLHKFCNLGDHRNNKVL